MMYSKRRLPDMEQWNQSSGSNIIPGRAHPGLAGLRPLTPTRVFPRVVRRRRRRLAVDHSGVPRVKEHADYSSTKTPTP